ncbi:MAG: glycoside hydrolase family 18 protein [Anaerolineae bacterium]|nr:glycoside hydrolase family 18 protein [Anaerolineae bacterium]
MGRYTQLLWICILVIFMLTACRPSSVPVEEPPPLASSTLVGSSSHEFVIVGYLPEYRALDPGWGAYITDIVYFSASIYATGGLDVERLEARTFADLRGMRERYGTRVFMAIGGWGRSQNFAIVTTNPVLRQQFVQTLTTYCLDNALNGVDFDWEFPANEEEVQGYTLLLAEVQKAFAPHGLQVSVALAAWQDLGPEAYQAVDRIHIMAYDHEGRHATLEQAITDVQDFVARGVPQEKLILGVPFYGRNILHPDTALTYAEIMARYHPAPDVDEAGGIYFNGMTMIQQKTRYALEQPLGGMMIWELGQDARDATSLLRAMYGVLRPE